MCRLHSFESKSFPFPLPSVFDSIHFSLTCQPLSSLVHPVQTLQQTVHLGFDLTQLSLNGMKLFSSHCKRQMARQGEKIFDSLLPPCRIVKGVLHLAEKLTSELVFRPFCRPQT